MSVHGECGRPVHYIMRRAMGTGSIIADYMPSPDGDLWAVDLGDHARAIFLYETTPDRYGARQYKVHECPKKVTS